MIAADFDRALDVVVGVIVFAFFAAVLLERLRRRLKKKGGWYVTKSGRVLTDADIQALADEAERGYDVDRLLESSDPLTLAVNRAYNTGEPVYWTKGMPLPDPEGPVLPIKEDE